MDLLVNTPLTSSCVWRIVSLSLPKSPRLRVCVYVERGRAIPKHLSGCTGNKIRLLLGAQLAKYADKIEATCTMNSLQEIRTKKEHDKFMKALGVTSIFDEIALKAFISSLKATGPPPRPRHTHTHTHTYICMQYANR